MKLACSYTNQLPDLFDNQDLRHALTRLHTNPSLIPLDTDRLMIPRKPVTSKPQLKSQIGRGHDNSNFKLTNIKLVSFREASSSFLFEHQFVLLNSFQIALNTAQFRNSSYSFVD